MTPHPAWPLSPQPSYVLLVSCTPRPGPSCVFSPDYCSPLLTGLPHRTLVHAYAHSHTLAHVCTHMLICIYVHAQVCSGTYMCKLTCRCAHPKRAFVHTQRPHGPTCAHTHRSSSSKSFLNPTARQPQVGACHSLFRSQSKPGPMWSVPILAQGWSPGSPRLLPHLCVGPSWCRVLLPPTLTSPNLTASTSCPDADVSPQHSPCPSITYLFVSFACRPRQNVYQMRTRIFVSSPMGLLWRTVPGTWMPSANIC